MILGEAKDLAPAPKSVSDLKPDPISNHPMIRLRPNHN